MMTGLMARTGPVKDDVQRGQDGRATKTLGIGRGRSIMGTVECSARVAGHLTSEDVGGCEECDNRW